MKLTHFFYLLLTGSFVSCAQPNTEVYLFDLSEKDGQLSLMNPVNISNNEGYDNQPSFLKNQPVVLFSSMKDSQMDAVSYNYHTKKSENLTNSSGSEFSPTQMPDEAYFSCIILEKNGQQLLWQYPLKGGTPMKVIPDLKVGYHAWINNDELYIFVLEENGNSLYHYQDGTDTKISDNPGRCLQLKPGTNLLTYLENGDEGAVLMTFDPATKEKVELAKAVQNSEDFIWISNDKILMGDNQKLLSFQTGTKSWKEEMSLSEFNLEGITRMAISSDKKKLAIVVNE